MPSEKILSQKQAEVADLVKKMQAAQSGVVVNYSGITVEQDTKLRAALRKAGVEYSVKKNSLIGRACDELGFEDMKSALNGMSAIATSETDPVAPAKILKEYADKIPTFEIKTGFLEGKVVDTMPPSASIAKVVPPLLANSTVN